MADELGQGQNLYKRLIIRFVLALVGIGVLIWVLPIALRLLYPFVFALVFAAILNPLVSRIHQGISKRHRESPRTRKIITLVLNILIVFILSASLFYLSYRIIKELVLFSNSIQQNWSGIVQKFDDFQERFAWQIGGLPPDIVDAFDGFKEDIGDTLQNIAKKLPSAVLATTASIITSTGTLLINFIMFFLAMYFFISDYHLITGFTKKYANEDLVKTFSVMKSSISDALGGYIRSQFILAFIAFVFMFICLGIYGQRYAFIIALLLAFIDLLPIVGTIAVLLPWGLVEWISGDIQQGMFLIVIGLVFFLLRRILEPRVMGSQTGLHPVLALISTYVGLKFSGIWGAILGPLVLMLVMSILKSGLLSGTGKDIKELFRRVATVLSLQAGE